MYFEAYSLRKSRFLILFCTQNQAHNFPLYEWNLNLCYINSITSNNILGKPIFAHRAMDKNMSHVDKAAHNLNRSFVRILHNSTHIECPICADANHL